MADRRLQVFHAVAKYLSFTRAADALFMSQPAVTFQIRQLEEEHNTCLFERRHGNISLTAAGELLLSYAEKILALSDEMETRLGEMTGEMRGTLLVGASHAAADRVMPPLLWEFNALYPQIRICLFVANSETVGQRVAEHGLHLGLIDGTGDVDGVDSDVCGEEELLVACAPDYPLAGLKQVTLDALLDYEYISRESGSGTRWATEEHLRQHGIDPAHLKTQMELGSPGTLKAVVASGLGFGLAGRAALAQEIARAELVAIPLKPALKCKLHLICPQGRFRTRLATTFIDFAKSKLRELAA